MKDIKNSNLEDHTPLVTVLATKISYLHSIMTYKFQEE